MSTDILKQTLSRTVIEQYLKTSEPVRISFLATTLKTNAKKVNELLWEMHRDFDLTDVPVETKNPYGSFLPSRHTTSPAVQPSRSLLVRLINSSRA